MVRAAGRCSSPASPQPAPPDLARRLARYVDGDQPDLDGRLPSSVRLAQLLEHDPADVDELLARWAASDGAAALAAPLGATEDGPLAVDLVADGPHALVAGTTGAGKSELLRTWVAGLAATVDPRQLNFVLVDYKGGAAFDVCSRLPHTVSVVTDLDESLAARALRCLEAELRRREARLREAGVDDLRRLPSTAAADRPGGRLARLVVIVDEFAALAAELPDFVDSLVDVAQRGRSLGVHLILATQRPAGVVSERVRANVALRIALQGAGSPGVPRRARRRRRGRPAPPPAGPGGRALRPGRGPHHADRPRLRPRPAGSGSSELAAIVAAARAAAARLGIGPPRSPWPPPLPDRLLLDELQADPADGGADLPVSTTRITRRGAPAHGTCAAGTCSWSAVGGAARRPRWRRSPLALARTSTAEPCTSTWSGPVPDHSTRSPACPTAVASSTWASRSGWPAWCSASAGSSTSAATSRLERRDGLPRVVVLVDDWTALQAALDEPGLAVLAEALERVAGRGHRRRHPRGAERRTSGRPAPGR